MGRLDKAKKDTKENRTANDLIFEDNTKNEQKISQKIENKKQIIKDDPNKYRVNVMLTPKLHTQLKKYSADVHKSLKQLTEEAIYQVYGKLLDKNID